MIDGFNMIEVETSWENTDGLTKTTVARRRCSSGLKLDLRTQVVKFYGTAWLVKLKVDFCLLL